MARHWERRTQRVLEAPVAAVLEVLGDLEQWPRWCAAVGQVDCTGRAPAPRAHGRADGNDEGPADGMDHGRAQRRLRGDYVPAHRLVGPLHALTAPSFEATVTASPDGGVVTLTQPIPTGAMTVEWTVSAADLPADGARPTLLVQRVCVTGPARRLVVAGIARALVAGFGTDADRLGRLARAGDTAPGNAER